MLPFLNVVFHSIKNAIEVDMKRESDIVYITDKYSVRGGGGEDISCSRRLKGK